MPCAQRARLHSAPWWPLPPASTCCVIVWHPLGRLVQQAGPPSCGRSIQPHQRSTATPSSTVTPTTCSPFPGAGRHAPAVPRSKRLLSDGGSNVLVYLAGHGGDDFMKFQDQEEIMGKVGGLGAQPESCYKAGPRWLIRELRAPVDPRHARFCTVRWARISTIAKHQVFLGTCFVLGSRKLHMPPRATSAA